MSQDGVSTRRAGSTQGAGAGRRDVALSPHDFALVEEMRGRFRPAGWQDVARALGKSEDLIRRCCDAGYVSPYDHEGGLPPQARGSGRTAKGGIGWAEPSPVETVPANSAMDAFHDAPPLSESAPRPPRQALGQPLTAPQRVDGKRLIESAPGRAAGPPGEGADCARPVPTARHYAIAVIAAATIYGDDPMRALTSTLKPHRRSLTAAASALQAVFGVIAKRAAGPIGASPSAISVYRIQGSDLWRRAEHSAQDALRYALAHGEPQGG